MKAVVFHGIGDVRLDEVKEPKLKDPTDAIVRLTASAICGTDLHMIRGTLPGMKPGTILGHEGVGVVEELGEDVRNFQRGRPRGHPLHHRLRQLLLLPRAATTRSATTANPNGTQAGTAFFGGPEPSGPFDGLQAEKARVPFAHVGLVKLPDEVTRRAGHPALGHLPHRLLRRGARRDQARQHGGGVRLRPGGPVRHRQRASCMGAGRVFAIDCMRRPAGDGARARAPRSSTSTRRTRSRRSTGSPAASAWTAPSTRWAWTPSRRTTGRAAKKAPGRRREFKREDEAGDRAEDEPGRRQLAPGRRALAGAASGRWRRWPRPARCPSSASTRRRRAPSPSARR